MWEYLPWLAIPTAGILAGVVAVLVWQSPDYSAKLGNLLSQGRKNFGIIDIAERGNRVSSHVVSFSETIAHVGPRVFIIPAQVRVRNGLPHAYYPYNDAIKNIAPIDALARIKAVIAGKPLPKQDENAPERPLDDSFFQKPSEKAQDPEVLNAAIMAVKAEAEAEAAGNMKQIKFFTMIILCIVVLTMILAYLTYDKSNSIAGAVEAVKAMIPGVIK